MENRICVLLLSLVALGCSGCAIFHRPAKQDDSAQPSSDSDNNAPPPTVIEPQVERRNIKVPTIRPSNLELGAYYGEISIQDFGAQPVAGVRLDYHISEDFFAEATYGRAKAGFTSFETLSNIQLISDAERRFTYYNLSLGYNLLPGEVFIGRNLAMTSSFYMIGGIGSVKFAGDQNFTVNFGAGFRVLPTDWLAVHIDVQDLVFRSDVTGVEELKNNLQATIGATVFF
ncbi:MAG TPA: outer membrane beta-barrel domain-containing protein [Steroidobacteraceae bacterium]|jgi:outer membrane beta-barrel protein|nr:outer membrane beta-barrel domain-containing protein [Steroidobacteraceae bacterium]